MLDNKLTDNEIVKALSNMTYGGHYCSKCKYDNGKGNDRCGLKGCKIARYALDLINRLQAEKENLKDILYDAEGVNLVNYWHQQCKIAENGCRNFAEENKRLQAENERLRGCKIF